MAPFVTRICDSGSTLRVGRPLELGRERPPQRAEPVHGRRRHPAGEHGGDRVDDVIGKRRGTGAVQRHGLDPGRECPPAPLLGLVGREAFGGAHDAGMTGSTTRDGYTLVWSTVWWATCMRVPVPTSSPVFRLREKRGKLELVTSSRMQWPRLEDVRDRIAADPVLGHLARLEQLDGLALEAAAVARPDDALGEEDRAAVGIDVAEADDEVGVEGRRRGVEHHLDRADHLEIARRAARSCRRARRRGARARAGRCGPGRIGVSAPCVIVSTELTPPIVGTGSAGS